MTKMKTYRALDVSLSIIVLAILAPVLFFLCVIGYCFFASPIFAQKRLGIHQKPFVLYKFRTMKIGTPSVATHLLDSKEFTWYGRFLRNTKLDELPQMLNVINGDMSLVGPRPGLQNHRELIEVREREGIYAVLPGVTGLAQVQGVDMSDPEALVRVERQMIEEMSLGYYAFIIFKTALGRK